MKDKILSVVRDHCRSKEYEKNTSAFISELVRLNRSEVAGFLNDFVDAGILIKITKKPILYLDKQWLEEICGKELKEKSYSSLEVVMKNDNDVHDFDKMVGSDGSLSDLVKQCKATIAYPPKGLAMMLYGPTGTGKSYIAKLAYEYAKRKELLSENGKFISVNCSEYANNPELLTANLFGHVKGAFTGADKDNSGLIALADGGVLFLDEVHNLKAECQEKLFLFMDQSIFHRVGDNEKWYESNVRLIFATTEDPEEVLLKTLQRRIPMTIHVPSLEERGMQERVQLLYVMFKEEMERLERKIKISSKVYNILLSHEFAGNIGGLKSCIQSCCVNSLFDVDENGEMLIQLRNLPKQILEKQMDKSQIFSSYNEFIDVLDLRGFVDNEKNIIRLNEVLLKYFQEYENDEIKKQDFFAKCKQSVRDYFDDILFRKYEVGEKDFYQNGVQHIFDLISNRYGIKITNNDLITISHYLNDYHKDYNSFQNWSSKSEKECSRFLDFLKEEYYRDFNIVLEVVYYLQSYLDMDVLKMVHITFLIFIKNMDNEVNSQKRLAVILAHGFSTASSIADATNKFLGKYVFDAIDMPINVDTEMIIQKLNLYLSRVGKYEELFLLVDMGSLEDIYKGLDVKKANIGIINNISTKAALGIGNGIIQNQSMEEIFKDVIEYTGTTYHIERNKQKENIILCSCASGIGTAENLRKIIQDSLPINIDLSVKTYNYNELLEKGLNDAFFDRYHVLCVIGTLNPNIEGLNFIPIEDLIISDSLNELNHYLEGYLDEKHLLLFKKNILKNFSLSNIMNSLTILNSNKLLEHVADAIDRLQNTMNAKFSNNTCFGLYVHISCLIERLVMHKEIDVYHNSDFEQMQQQFILMVKQTFKEVEEFYGVELSIAEIGYIFDYIQNDMNY